MHKDVTVIAMGVPIVSLFCGAGGLDCGFRSAGFQPIFACDNWGDAVRTYNFNAKRNIAIQLDLLTATAAEVGDLVAQRCGSTMPVGVIGGPPCQGFSRGNVHALAADPRNQLPFRYAQIVKEFKRRFGIRFFVFENVLGLLSAKHVARFGDIKDAFKEAGFKVFQSDLNAVAFGVPQRRRRLFIVGLNDTLEADTEFAFPEGTAPAVTLRQAIGQLPAPAYFARGLPTREIPHHANHWTMVPRSPKFTAAVATEGRSFRRLKWDEPSPTVAYGHREIHVHPDGSRRLSVYEAMLLQGFPPKYRLLGCFSSQVTQVSNAVPPPLARVLAKKLHDLVVSKPSGGPEMTEREQVTQVSNAISRPIAAAIAGSLCRVLTSRNELAFAAHSTATR